MQCGDNLLAVVGSLAMLFVHDRDAGFIAMAVRLPMGVVNAWYWRRAVRLNQGIHNQIEREVQDIASASPFSREPAFPAAAALAHQAVGCRVMGMRPANPS